MELGSTCSISTRARLNAVVETVRIVEMQPVRVVGWIEVQGMVSRPSVLCC